MSDKTFEIKGGNNQILPEGTEAKQFNYYSATPSRMVSDFLRLRQEILNGVKTETIEELKQYITILDGTKPFEEKLEDGGFKPARIEDASRQMLLYAKKAEMLDCYPSAQQILPRLQYCFLSPGKVKFQ